MNRALAAITLAALAVAPLACTTGDARSNVTTADIQRGMSPQDVLNDLKRGNDRFASGNSTRQDYLAQAETTADEGQFPKAIVLGCPDSRVPPEALFDQGIGDIFVGRVAGNFENTDLLGSMEFGTAIAGSKLIVVLGHTSCGAVKGAIDRARLGNLTALLAEIEPAIDAVPHTPSERSSDNEDFVNRVIEANVRTTVQDILERSPVLAQRVRDGDLMVVGAVYDLETGRVRWLDA